MNRLLQRQLQQHIGDPNQLPENFRAFLKAVSDSYDHYEQDRKMLERSIELSSNEMIALNEQLRRDILARIEGEKRYRLLHETPFLGIAYGTIGGHLQSANEAFCKITGYSPEELRNMHFSDFSHPDDVEKEIPFIQKMIAGETDSYRMEKRYVGKNGRVNWVELNVTCSKDEKGQIEYVIAAVTDISQRKKAEESLELALDRLKEAQQIGKLGHWELDLATAKSTWSDEAFRTYGYRPGEAEPSFEFFLKHIHPDDRERVKAAVNESRKTFGSFSFQHRIIDAKGVHKHILSIGRYEMDKTHRPVRLFGISLDLTELKEKEEQLKHAEANLRTILENTETAFLLLDTNATVLSFNHQARDLVVQERGIVLEEGMNYLAVVSDNRKAEMRGRIDEVLQGQPISFDVNYRKEGVWFHVSMHPIFDAEKKVLGLSVAATNITERKNAEQLLRQSNERYEFVTKATNDVIWDWDITENRVYRSPNFVQVLGSAENAGDITLADWFSRIHPEDRPQVSASVQEKLEHPDSPTWEFEYRFYRSNGDLGYMHDRGHVILDENQRPVRMVGAMRDITSEKLFAIERERTTSRLIKQNRDLEQFAYIVSHNLRAPVANLIGLARIIGSGNLDEATQHQCIDGLAQSVKKLDDVITDLNFILQVRHGVNEKKENVRFSTLVEDIKTSVSDLIRKEDILIKTDFSEVDEMFTMKSYLYSIFYNLISNSIKYRTTRERPVIEISSSGGNGTIRLQFRDNGIGIDLNANGRTLFGLYKRFHPNTEGKGMGLFMVKTQVETLGGNIFVQSRVNEGTQFTLEFNPHAAAPIV